MEFVINFFGSYITSIFLCQITWTLGKMENLNMDNQGQTVQYMLDVWLVHFYCYAVILDCLLHIQHIQENYLSGTPSALIG